MEWTLWHSTVAGGLNQRVGVSRWWSEGGRQEITRVAMMADDEVEDKLSRLSNGVGMGSLEERISRN